jgi:putative peptide zinc metalloprotease protein
MKIEKKHIEKLSRIEDGYVAKIGEEYVFLSKDSKLVWDICDQVDSIDEIQKKLSTIYSDVEEIAVVNALEALKSNGLIEIQNGMGEFSRASRESGDSRPIKKVKIVGRERVVKILRISELLLGFLTHDGSIIVAYTIPWLVFLFYIAYTRTNPFLLFPFMNYAVVVLLFPILLLHELAHAVVSEKLGAAVNGFGVGVYSIVFFLYTDTSETLLLRRKDRMKVSLAGPAINFIFGLVFVLIAVFLGSEDSFVLSSLLFLSGTAALVPIFESDGHYVLMDYGRINNPRKELFSYLQSIVGKTTQNLKRRQKATLVIYLSSCFFSIFLIVYFCLFFFPVYVQREINYINDFSNLSTFDIASFAFGALYLVLLISVGLSFAYEKILKQLAHALRGR